MKSILMIGMGKFGHLLCMNMAKLDNEIMIVDEDEERLSDLLPLVTSAQIGDCTNVEVLKSMGIRNFDVCFVCISGNFQNSLEITSLLKELGASYVVSKAERDIQAKFLLRNGADEVIYPERDTAERAAKKFSSECAEQLAVRAQSSYEGGREDQLLIEKSGKFGPRGSRSPEK